MFRSICNTIPRDRDFSDRVFRHEVLRRVLEGTLYDGLANEFHDEARPGGDYIPLRERAPSVRYNMAHILVTDATSFTFGEGRFPTVDSPDPATREALASVIRHCGLQQIMVSAAITGSIGSAAVLMRVLKNRLYFEVVATQFLTPTYQADAPDELLKVVQRYKVKGADLVEMGYLIPADNLRSDYWFQRQFDMNAETYFVPLLVSQLREKPQAMQPDPDRMVQHNLGFVPLVWIKNLPGGTGHDGACTFEPAILTQIEIEYQLSQAGRALKYSGDPLLLIKESNAGEASSLRRDASNALTVSEDGDARLLELTGGSAQAVINYVRTLREMALETCHGNRSPIDKLSLPQSGKAMELLYLPLVSLADTMRGSYGEQGLSHLLKMVQRAASMFPLICNDQPLPRLNPTAMLALRWPDYFAPTDPDRQQQAQSLAELVAAGLMSRQTAVHVLSKRYDIEDVAAEIVLIEADEAARAAEAAALLAVQAKKNVIPNE